MTSNSLFALDYILTNNTPELSSTPPPKLTNKGKSGSIDLDIMVPDSTIQRQDILVQWIQRQWIQQ